VVGGDRYVVQENRPTRSQGEVLDFAGRLPDPRDPEAGFDAEAKVPAQAAQGGQEVRIGKAPIGQKDSLDPWRQQRWDGLQQGRIRLIGHTATAMLHHLPDQGYGSPPIHEGDAQDAVPIPQHAGIQRHLHPVFPPLGQGRLDQRRLQRMDLHPRIAQPAGKPPLGTLGIARPSPHEGHPGRETHTARVAEPHHPPDQSVEMAHLAPLAMLTQ
jgi:hypothetical protein